jgi:hypothetical protein
MTDLPGHSPRSRNTGPVVGQRPANSRCRDRVPAAFSPRGDGEGKGGNPGENAPGYLLLDEALAAGLAAVTEISEAGSVPDLLVKNLAPSPVLILDGEELVGARQNRIVNLTILVAAQQALHIPVSSVEAGRWAAHSREFEAAGRMNAESATHAAAEMYERSRAKRVRVEEGFQTSALTHGRAASGPAAAGRKSGLNSLATHLYDLSGLDLDQGLFYQRQ